MKTKITLQDRVELVPSKDCPRIPFQLIPNTGDPTATRYRTVATMQAEGVLNLRFAPRDSIVGDLVSDTGYLI